MRIIKILSIIFVLFLNFSAFGSKDVFKEMSKKNWSTAYKKAKRTGSKPLQKIVLSQKYLDKNCSTNSFEKTVRFLQSNPEWPQNILLKIRAESYLNSSSNKKTIYNWFSKNKPVTAKGYKYYFKAVLSYSNNNSNIESIFKKAWQKGAFTLDEQKLYGKKYKKYISQEDNVRRIDNMLWDGRISAAKSNLYLVSNGYRKSFKAQMDLIRGKKINIKSINSKYYTSGLVYRYLNSIKHSPSNGKRIAKYTKYAKYDTDHGDKFSKILLYIARELMEKKRFTEAYLVVSSSFAKGAACKSDAEFLSGWLAASFINKPSKALEHFREFSRVVKTPISKARGVYWMARAYEAIKEKEKAKNLYEMGASKYAYTFYGQMCAVELGNSKISLPSDSSSVNAVNDITKAAKLVSKYGSKGLAHVYLKESIKSARSAGEVVASVKAISKDKNLHFTTWAAKYALQKHVYLGSLAYPAPYKLKNSVLDKSLVYSIIRQESVFDQYARSSADARGLMQLLPGTARDTSRKIGIKYRLLKLTKTPEYNIKLGSNYLKMMIDEYKGSYIMAIAAYNAGPHNVNKWMERFGDPRKFSNHRKVINWMELIPYYETRNYVQRVLENLQIYRTKLSNNKLMLKKDLIR